MGSIKHLSYSSLALYGECPKKFEFRYLEELPSKGSGATVFGRAVHATVGSLIEAAHAGDSDPDVAAIWQMHWEKESTSHPVEWGKDDPATLAESGLRLVTFEPVKQLVTGLKPQLEDGKPVIEKKVELKVAGVPVPVIGFVDFIGADGVVRDFKTAQRSWHPAQAEQETQPLIYFAALEQMGHDHAPLQFEHVVFVKKTIPDVQVIPTEYSRAAVDWMLDSIGEIWRAIAGRVFPPAPKACNNWGRRCEYWDRCKGGKK